MSIFIAGVQTKRREYVFNGLSCLLGVRKLAHRYSQSPWLVSSLGASQERLHGGLVRFTPAELMKSRRRGQWLWECKEKSRSVSLPPSLSISVSLFLCLPASRFVFVIVRTLVTSAYEFATSCFSLSVHLRVCVYTRTNMPMYAHVMYVDHDYR